MFLNSFHNGFQRFSQFSYVLQLRSYASTCLYIVSITVFKGFRSFHMFCNYAYILFTVWAHLRLRLRQQPLPGLVESVHLCCSHRLLLATPIAATTLMCHASASTTDRPDFKDFDSLGLPPSIQNPLDLFRLLILPETMREQVQLSCCKVRCHCEKIDRSCGETVH